MRTHAPRRAGDSKAELKAVRSRDARNVARYIADMTSQMEKMAGETGLDLLAYFLAMARAESEAIARGRDEPNA
jgi:hypothetical protein